ncbi:MAG: hypothetical protein QME75_02350 [Deltaproteobacteria bacterium]|nr:hypothetical protein [Deltaproteobacteria bacterium]
MYVVEKLKQVLGLGFAASEMGVIESVESMCKTMAEIKDALGLPPDADCQQIMQAIEAKKKEPEVEVVQPQMAAGGGWFKKLFGG